MSYVVSRNQQINWTNMQHLLKTRDVIGHLPHGKSRKFANTVFYFLKSDENHHCKITVTGKGTNAGDERGMKVPCQLFFLVEEKFIITLQEKLSKLL